MHLPKLARNRLFSLFSTLCVAFGSCLALGACLSLGACQEATPAAPAPVVEPAAFEPARAWKLLQQQVAFGPRPSGSEANVKTRDWLVKELESYGLKPEREAFTADTPAGEIAMENIYAQLEGPAGPKGEPAPIIVLGSHFDTKVMPFEFVGANDGASSTAVLLELARVLAAGPTPPVSYRFVFFDGEEAVRMDWIDPDNRYGSKHHVKQLDMRKGLRKRVKAMILMDLVGDADLQLEYDSSSTRRLLEVFVKTAKSIGDPDLFSRISYPVEDDHEPFIRQGIPSVDLIDLHYGPLANEYWHTSEDTIEHCSEESLGRVGRLVLAALPDVIRTYVR